MQLSGDLAFAHGERWVDRGWAQCDCMRASSGGQGGVGDETPVDIHLQNAETLLDLGCGDGSWLDTHPQQRAIGIDNNQPLGGGAEGRSWTFLLANLDEGIPVEDGWASAIRANQVIEHIRNPLQLFSEVHRVLRPGGVFVATTPNIRYAKHLFRLAIRGEGPMTSHRAERSASVWDDGHIHYFTARDLEWLAARAGFTTYHTEALVERQGGFRVIRAVLDRWRRTSVVKGVLSGNLLLVAKK